MTEFMLFNRTTPAGVEVRVMVKRGDVWKVGGILQLTADEWTFFVSATGFNTMQLEPGASFASTEPVA
jgi:hypothetical protein